MSSSDDAIVTVDPDGLTTSWSAGAERLFGYRAAEMIGRSLVSLVPPDREREYADVMARLRRGERVEHLETFRQDRAGARFPVCITGVPLRDGAGQVVGAVSVIRDRRETPGHDQDAYRLAAIVASSDDAIVSKNLDGIIISWNAAAERMFEYSASEAIGRSIRMIIPADRQHEEDEVLARIRRGDKIDHFETIRQKKSGVLFPISLTVSPIRDSQGTVIGASKIARDLSPLRAYATQLEQQVKERTAALEASNAQLEAFAYSVSHDLRAPLRGMQGLSQALLEDYGDRLDEIGRDYATRIVQEAALLDQLIRDLLAYSRLTRIDVALERVELAEVIQVSLGSLRNEIDASGARIIVADALPSVWGNRAVLIQIVTNLLSNAVKFGGPAPEVRVWTTRADDTIRLWVEDHGIGIDPQHHERIFRVFERLHGSEAYPGTGIGLAIVRRGAERIGGRAGLESQEGRGSRFWVDLPQGVIAA